jgi:UDP-N-acetylglucosamine 2-epimerase (non-hydrolysing)
MKRFEPALLKEMPDWLVVVGDVNSTMACTLVAAKLGVRVAHVEAGLRSYDRAMPEEINRLVTDAIADLLLTPSPDADENLRREGVAAERIRLVGNIMIDSLVAHIGKAETNGILQRLSLQEGSFLYVTLHRPSNVDEKPTLARIVAELANVSRRLPVIFPIHPRTRKRMEEFGLTFPDKAPVRLIDPVGYQDSIALASNARCIVTDSGGLQEESTYFRTPCLTLRPNTERPVTITMGSNRLTTIERLGQDLTQVLDGEKRIGQLPPLWDGKTGERIVQVLLSA